MKKILLAVGFASLIATPALANPNCLELSQIWSWKALDNKTLIVEDNWHQKFKLSLSGEEIRVEYTPFDFPDGRTDLLTLKGWFEAPADPAHDRAAGGIGRRSQSRKWLCLRRFQAPVPARRSASSPGF